MTFGNAITSRTASKAWSSPAWMTAPERPKCAFHRVTLSSRSLDEAVANATDVRNRIEQLEKDGRKSALLQISNGEGDSVLWRWGYNSPASAPFLAKWGGGTPPAVMLALVSGVVPWRLATRVSSGYWSAARGGGE